MKKYLKKTTLIGLSHLKKNYEVFIETNKKIENYLHRIEYFKNLSKDYLKRIQIHKSRVEYFKNRS